jgi:hypothetical protein
MSVTFGGQHVALGDDPNYRANEQDSNRLPND